MSKIVLNSEKKTNHLKQKTCRIDKYVGFLRGACNLPSEMVATHRTKAPIVIKQKTSIVKSFEEINKGDKNIDEKHDYPSRHS